MNDRSSGLHSKGTYAVAKASCTPGDSGALMAWITRFVQTPVLVEEGETTLLTFTLPCSTTGHEWLLFEAAVKSLGCRTLEIHRYEEKDWQQLWKDQGFKRFQTLDRLTVVPVWDEEPVSGLSIVLDPQLAFGTGWHETTRNCLERLVTLSAAHSVTGEILDFGCGTGILGVAALKLNLSASLISIDNDELAVEATRHNLALNRMDKRSGVYLSLDAWREDRRSKGRGLKTDGEFWLIMANVTGGVILDVAEQLWAMVAGGGFLVFSGVSQEERIPVEHLLCLFVPSFQTIEGERYSTYVLEKEVDH